MLFRYYTVLNLHISICTVLNLYKVLYKLITVRVNWEEKRVELNMTRICHFLPLIIKFSQAAMRTIKL